jgi:hypothetical protein
LKKNENEDIHHLYKNEKATDPVSPQQAESSKEQPPKIEIDILDNIISSQTLNLD